MIGRPVTLLERVNCLSKQFIGLKIAPVVKKQWFSKFLLSSVSHVGQIIISPIDDRQGNRYNQNVYRPHGAYI